MKSFSLSTLIFTVTMACSTMAGIGHAQEETPHADEFNLYRLGSTDNKIELSWIESVPTSEEVEHEDGSQEVRTVIKEVEQTREIPKENIRFQTVGGTQVSFSELGKYKNKPVIVFGKETKIGALYKQVFNENALVGFLFAEGTR